MKITKSELKQIIKEEAERFVKITALEKKKANLTKQINEIYEEESMEESMEESEEENLKELFGFGTKKAMTSLRIQVIIFRNFNIINSISLIIILCLIFLFFI